MRGEKGLRQTGQTVRKSRDRALKPGPDIILNRIRRAIGRGISPDIAADATNEVYLAIPEGRVPQDRIEQETRRTVSRVLNDFANGYAFVNIDERDADGLSLSDCLVDTAAEAAVEFAGAQAMGASSRGAYISAHA